MLDLIPLAGAGRKVADRNNQPAFGAEILELGLPQPNTCPVAATAVGGDQQALGAGIKRPAHALPPAANRFNGKCRRIMINPYIDPTAASRF